MLFVGNMIELAAAQAGGRSNPRRPPIATDEDGHARRRASVAWLV